MSRFDKLIGAQRGLLLTTVPRRVAPKDGGRVSSSAWPPALPGRGDLGEGSHGLLDSGEWLDWSLRGQERVRLEMAESGAGLKGGPQPWASCRWRTRCRTLAAEEARGMERLRAQSDSSG